MKAILRALGVIWFFCLMLTLPLASGCNWGSPTPSGPTTNTTSPLASPTDDQATSGAKSEVEHTSPKTVANLDDWMAWAKKQAEVAGKEFEQFSEQEKLCAQGKLKTLDPKKMVQGDVGKIKSLRVVQVLDENRFLAESGDQNFIVQGAPTKEYLDEREYEFGGAMFSVVEYTTYADASGGTSKVPLLSVRSCRDATEAWRHTIRPKEAAEAVQWIRELLEKGRSIEGMVGLKGEATKKELEELEKLRDQFNDITNALLMFDNRFLEIEFKEHRELDELLKRLLPGAK